MLKKSFFFTSKEVIGIHVHGSSSSARASQISSEKFCENLFYWNAADICPSVRSVARNDVIGFFDCILHADAAGLLAVV